MIKKCLYCGKKLPERRYRYCSNYCIKSAWRKRNIKKHNRINRVWRENNPNYFKEYHSKNYIYKGHSVNSGSFEKGSIPWNKGKILPTTPIKIYIRQSERYKKWRLDIFKRDNFVCQVCGIKGGWNKKLKKRIIIQADHIYPLSKILNEEKLKNVKDVMNCKRLWDKKNGRTLCYKCHRKTKSWGTNL